MRALPIVITAALLAGCAAQPTQTVWARLDGTKATQAQLAQDEAACRYEAAQLAYQRPERRPPSAYYSNQQIGAGFNNLARSDEHTSTPVTNAHTVCRLLLEKKKKTPS